MSGQLTKDLERLRNKKNGWGQEFYARFLKKAGFLPREGGKHTIYIDPDDPENVVIVPRHGELLGYIADLAILAVEKRLERLESNEQ